MVLFQFLSSGLCLLSHVRSSRMYYYYCEFFKSALAEVFYWSLSDSKSSQVSRTLLNILADLNNTVIWMVSACSTISNRPLTKSLGIVPSTPTTNGITVTFILHSFFSSQSRLKYLPRFLFSLIFTLRSARMAKSTIRHVLFFFRELSQGLVFWSGSDYYYYYYYH